MELDDSSRLSTSPEMEPVMDWLLVLTTLSGVTIKVSLSVAKFDPFEDLEDQARTVWCQSLTTKQCIDSWLRGIQSLCGMLLLTWVCASDGVANRFSSLFQGYINLAEFMLGELPFSRGSTLQAATSELASGCLSSTEITHLLSRSILQLFGAHACDSCRLLKRVHWPQRSSPSACSPYNSS